MHCCIKKKKTIIVRNFFYMHSPTEFSSQPSSINPMKSCDIVTQRDIKTIYMLYFICHSLSISITCTYNNLNVHNFM